MGDSVKEFTKSPLKAAGSMLGAGAAMPLGAVGMLGGAKIGGALASGKNPFSNKIDVPGAQAKPEWTLSSLDGKLREDLQLGSKLPQAATQSQSVLNKLQDRAMADGPSAQAKYLQGANQRSMENAMGQADQMSGAAQAQATSRMAMRGGVDSGNRERMAKSFGFENLMNKQRIANDARGADLNILSQDEAGKESLMKALPASLLGQAGFEQDQKRFDITNTLNTVGGKYNADMSAWGANQTAREQAELANKKNGLFGLGIGGVL